jgi:RimJ/RimL family protein N-acetyltransferase
MKFCVADLGIKNLHLRVFSDNARAIKYYKTCGFSEIGKIPLKKTEDTNCTKWEPSQDLDIYHAERSYTVMHINLENFG